MAHKSKPRDVQPTQRPLSLQGAVEEAARCLLCEDAPCSRNCPGGTDPGKFVRQIRFANYKGAARTVRGNNVFGFACAYACPVENFCEKECTRAKLDRPIDIAGLQGFACEWGRSHGLEAMEPGAPTGRRVAIIGAGPAGMSCAAALAQAGHSVVVFEREAKAGGAAMWGIPEFRLPDAAVGHAHQCLKELGVEVRFGHEVHGAGSIMKLLSDGFDACFVSTGLSHQASLDVLEGYPNAVTAGEFLRCAKSRAGAPDIAGRNVVVIGGGSVAMDAAVTARKMGARHVYVVLRRELAQLKANEGEIELAHEAEVVFRPNSQVTGVATDENGSIVQVKGTEVEWSSTDGSVPSHAIPVVGTEFGLKADLVVQAIGYDVEADADEVAPELPHARGGAIAVDSGGFTGMEGVFAGGDIARGGATIVEAISDGKRAARSMDKFLSGRA